MQDAALRILGIVRKQSSEEHLKAVKVFFFLLAVALGILYTAASRHYMNPDGISYLDIADNYWSGDFGAAINTHWSPLYSWILGLVLTIAASPPFWEATIVHVVNLGIYLVSLLIFTFFWDSLFQWLTVKRDKSLSHFQLIPEWTWWALGYSLFLWAALDLISIQQVTPDMLVFALVLLAAGLTLHIYLGRNNWLIFTILGLVLGLGFLTKAAMFPMALVFLGVSVFATGSLRKSLPKIFLAFIIFALMAGPFIVAMSLSNGRFMFGDSAMLNYAWHVNGVRPLYVHWQGGDDFGEPIHPTRLIAQEPNIYEFASPIRGTYPPWYDPAYWHEGIDSKFILGDQIAVLINNISKYYNILLRQQAGLVVAVLVLYMASKRKLLIAQDIGELWPIIVPALVALGMYSLVHIETRYIGPFVLLFWAGAFASVRLSRSEQSRQLVIYLILSVVTFMMINRGALVVEIVRKSYSLVDWQDRRSHVQWQIAGELREIGLKDGDKVAFIGYSLDAYWARLGGMQIITDIFEHKGPDDDKSDIEFFWTADQVTRERAMSVIENTGVKAVVADDYPVGSTIDGWQRLENNGFYVFPFDD